MITDEKRIGWVEVGLKQQPNKDPGGYFGPTRWFAAICYYRQGTDEQRVEVFDFDYQHHVSDFLAHRHPARDIVCVFYGFVTIDSNQEYMTYPNVDNKNLRLYGYSEPEPLDWVPAVMDELNRRFDTLTGVDH